MRLMQGSNGVARVPLARISRLSLLAGAAVAFISACSTPPVEPVTATGPVAVATPTDRSIAVTPPSSRSGSVPARGAVNVSVLAINDFHGYLKPYAAGIRVREAGNAGRSVIVAAGGAEHLATAIAEARQRNPNHIVVGAGDLIGASPFMSAHFHDEPTIESLSQMGLEASAVGNHEFENGVSELLRMQNGGCHPADGCSGPTPFKGATFKYLAANVIDAKSGQTLFAPYYIKHFEGIPVAFIGATLRGTVGMVPEGSVRGLRFDDEVAAVNRTVRELRGQGIEAIVVLLHQGGISSGGLNDCDGLSGPVVNLVPKLDKAVDVVLNGHTHRSYICRIDGRLVTNGDKYGALLTRIDLQLDPVTKDVIRSTGENIVVSPERFARDPAQTALIADYEKRAAPLARRVVGRTTAAVSRDTNAAGESPMGELVADAMLAATQGAGAQLALATPGSIRSGLPLATDGLVRYEDLFAAQPFGNTLVTLTISGEQLRQLLEHQWSNPTYPAGRILQVSRGFSYAWDSRRPSGRRVVPGSIRLDGKPIGDSEDLRVTVTSMMAQGGGAASPFRSKRSLQNGPTDIVALEAHVTAASPLTPSKPDRIRRID